MDGWIREAVQPGRSELNDQSSMRGQRSWLELTDQPEAANWEETGQAPARQGNEDSVSGWYLVKPAVSTAVSLADTVGWCTMETQSPERTVCSTTVSSSLQVRLSPGVKGSCGEQVGLVVSAELLASPILDAPGDDVLLTSGQMSGWERVMISKANRIPPTQTQSLRLSSVSSPKRSKVAQIKTNKN